MKQGRVNLSTAGRHAATILDGSESIRCVAFDAVGTLVFADPPVASTYCQVGRKYGSVLTEHEVQHRFATAFHASENVDRSQPNEQPAIDRLATDESQERHRWRTIVAEVFNDVERLDECFEELFEYFALGSAWKCFDDVDETLAVLQDRGYRLAIASNFDNRLNAVCDSFESLKQIGYRVISSLVGSRKPSFKFYRALLRETECRSDELLMIGDDYDNDVIGARDAGIKVLQIDRSSPPKTGSRIASLRELTELLT